MVIELDALIARGRGACGAGGREGAGGGQGAGVVVVFLVRNRDRTDAVDGILYSQSDIHGGTIFQFTACFLLFILVSSWNSNKKNVKMVLFSKILLSFSKIVLSFSKIVLSFPQKVLSFSKMLLPN